LRGAVDLQVQGLRLPPWYTILSRSWCFGFAFSVLFSNPAQGHLPWGRRRKHMKIRTIIAATCAVPAFSMAGPVSADDGEAETVTKNFRCGVER
jgi:hypothetical protein